MKKTRYNLNHKYFNVPTVNNSYYAGFIAADGCISLYKKRAKRLLLGIHTKDVSILKNLKKEINYTGPITKQNNKSEVRLQVSSDELCKNLQKNFNIVSRKSLTLKPPKGLTNEQTLAYIIGYIDGDGSINKSKNTIRVSILGTKKQISFINTFLFLKYGIKSSVYKYPYNSTYELWIFRKESLKTLNKISKLINFKLKRKWDLLENV